MIILFLIYNLEIITYSDRWELIFAIAAINKHFKPEDNASFSNSTLKYTKL